MRAAVYRETGSADVLHIVERPEPSPGPGEVVVEVKVSGVNPTDWKSRQGGAPGQPPPFPEVVPNQDGAGVVVATGQGVDAGRIGERVWLWEAAWQRPDGTAQERLAIPEPPGRAPPRHGVVRPWCQHRDPGAHRPSLPHGRRAERLHPGALEGQVVLVAGGAGAVGHAAIELAKWAGARVAATVSSAAKEALRCGGRRRPRRQLPGAGRREGGARLGARRRGHGRRGGGRCQRRLGHRPPAHGRDRRLLRQRPRRGVDPDPGVHAWPTPAGSSCWSTPSPGRRRAMPSPTSAPRSPTGPCAWVRGRPSAAPVPARAHRRRAPSRRVGRHREGARRNRLTAGPGECSEVGEKGAFQPVTQSEARV